MFDVSWSDPQVLTVGQHRQRKDQDDGGRTSQRSRRSSLKSSKSSNSGISSQTVKSSERGKSSGTGTGWGFFGKSKKQPEKGKGKEKESESSRSKTPTTAPTSTTLSAYKEAPNDDIQRTVLTRIRGVESSDLASSRASIADSIQTSPSTIADSVLSGRPSRSIATESSWGSISEATPRNNSYVTSQPTTPGSDSTASTGLFPSEYSLDKSMDDLHISLNEEEIGFIVDNRISFPKVPSNPVLHQGRSNSQLGMSRKQKEHSSLASSSSRASTPINRALPKPPEPEKIAMQKHIRRMEAATPRIILERLKEDWSDVTDEAMYNELEFDMQLWMLLGYRILTNKATGSERKNSEPSAASSSSTAKFLSLYENQACANFLSVSPPTASKTYHLSLKPLPIGQATHIRTVFVSTPIPTLPYTPSTFTTISCLQLPSLLPSSSIPTILEECHRVLLPGGSLNLTIIDPNPDQSTLGPKMTAWLEDCLILNLETQSRCLRPSRLVPIWLKKAGFQSSDISATASTQTLKMASIPFYAIAQGEGGYSDGAEKDKKRQESEMLASTIGRMLWKEIWGSYVVGKKWWWEDEDIAEECFARGTKWDMLHLRVIK